MGRRSRGDGSVRRRADGRWEARLRLGNGARQSVFAKTQREVSAKLRALHGEQDAGLRINGRRQPVERYIQTWLDQRNPQTRAAGVRKLRHTTWAGYESRMRTHVYPAIGRLAIGQLTPEHVRAMLTKVAASNLSATTVAMVRDTLATILQRAVKDRVLPYNPVHAVDSVTRSKANTYVLTPERARDLIRAAAGDPYEAR